jgi:hypothetical protein
LATAMRRGGADWPRGGAPAGRKTRRWRLARELRAGRLGKDEAGPGERGEARRRAMLTRGRHGSREREVALCGSGQSRARGAGKGAEGGDELGLGC